MSCALCARQAAVIMISAGGWLSAPHGVVLCMHVELGRDTHGMVHDQHIMPIPSSSRSLLTLQTFRICHRPSSNVASRALHGRSRLPSNIHIHAHPRDGWVARASRSTRTRARADERSMSTSPPRATCLSVHVSLLPADGLSAWSAPEESSALSWCAAPICSSCW